MSIEDGTVLKMLGSEAKEPKDGSDSCISESTGAGLLVAAGFASRAARPFAPTAAPFSFADPELRTGFVWRSKNAQQDGLAALE